MNSAAVPDRPDTTMGLALARRVLAHVDPVRPAAATDLIDLTTPEPGRTPDHVGQAAKSALEQGETHYTDASGIQPLRGAVAEHLHELGFPVDPESIGISNGGTEAIYIVLQVALQPGDRLLIVEPMSPHIVDMVTFIGATPLRIETSAASGFAPDPAVLEKVDAKALLVASPSPVTGKRIPDAALERLVTAARERDMSVILDLSYAAGLYAPQPVNLGNARLAGEIALIGSFSTAHGLSGWRIGFFSAPPADRVLLQGLKTAMSICTTAVSQIAAAAALGKPSEWFEERRAHFTAHRDLATGMLDGAGLPYIAPDAFPPLLIDVGRLGGGEAIAKKLREDPGLIVDSGSRFGASTSDYIRINLGAPGDDLATGIERIITLHEANGRNGQDG